MESWVDVGMGHSAVVLAETEAFDRALAMISAQPARARAVVDEIAGRLAGLPHLLPSIFDHAAAAFLDTGSSPASRNESIATELFGKLATSNGRTGCRSTTPPTCVSSASSVPRPSTPTRRTWAPAPTLWRRTTRSRPCACTARWAACRRGRTRPVCCASSPRPRSSGRPKTTRCSPPWSGRRRCARPRRSSGRRTVPRCCGRRQSRQRYVNGWRGCSRSAITAWTSTTGGWRCSSRRVPLNPPPARAVVDVSRWLRTDPANRGNLAALAADPLRRPGLVVGVERFLRDGHSVDEIDTGALRALVDEWLATRIERLHGCAELASAHGQLSRPTSATSFVARPAMFAALAAVNPAEVLATTLRGGLLDELHWPALAEVAAHFHCRRPIGFDNPSHQAVADALPPGDSPRRPLRHSVR